MPPLKASEAVELPGYWASKIQVRLGIEVLGWFWIDLDRSQIALTSKLNSRGWSLRDGTATGAL
jgi:hypothetical protein